jgi:hypothetical protein
MDSLEKQLNALMEAGRNDGHSGDKLETPSTKLKE